MSDSESPQSSAPSPLLLQWPLPPPSSQPRNRVPEPDSATRQRLELEDLMRSSPPPEDLGSPSPSGTNHPSSDDSSFTNRPTQSPRAVSGGRNDIVIARRLAIKMKLHPYQREAVEEFVQVGHTYQQL